MTVSRTLTVSLTLALAIASPSILSAQETSSKILAALTTDSTAWQRVVVFTIATLSTQIVATANDPTAQPWRLQLPPDDPQAELIGTQLRTILRARQAMPADTIVRSLEFGPLVISNDTARVNVRFGETRKCHGTDRTTGSGWSTVVLVPREPKEKFWGAAFSRTIMGGDRLGC